MNRCYILNYEELLLQLEYLGLEKFASRYIKYDVLIGESHAITFIETKIKEHYDKIKTGGPTTIENT